MVDGSIAMYGIADGTVVATRQLNDMLSVLMQIGLVPLLQ